MKREPGSLFDSFDDEDEEELYDLESDLPLESDLDQETEYLEKKKYKRIRDIIDDEEY